MAHLLVWGLLLVAGKASSAQQPGRIIGGEDTTIDNFPSTVQVESVLGIFWTQTCAATILTSTYMLTAAQCTSGIIVAPFRRVRAGSSFRGRGGSVHGVAHIINHPNYGQDGHDSDIALIRLADRLVYSPEVQQGSIVAANSVIPATTPLEKVGWGATTEGGESAEQLQKTTVLVVDHALCAESYQTLEPAVSVTANMICTGLPAGGQGACSGDAGGPAFYGNIVVGIISWGEGCGNATFPRLNTNVGSYTDWIVANASD